MVSSYLSAGEAVHYALHHILGLVTIDDAPPKRPLNGVVADSNQKVWPVLALPEVFDLYHLSNQTAPLVASHAIVGTSSLERECVSLISLSLFPSAQSLLSASRERPGKNIDQEKVI